MLPVIGIMAIVVWPAPRTGKMYGLLTKCEVKMAGYWLSSFFTCLLTKTQSRSINSQ